MSSAESDQIDDFRKPLLTRRSIGCCAAILILPVLLLLTGSIILAITLSRILDPYSGAAPAAIFDIPPSAFRELVDLHPALNIVPDVLSLGRYTTPEEIDKRFPDSKTTDAYNYAARDPDNTWFGHTYFYSAMTHDFDLIKRTTDFHFDNVLSSASITYQGEKVAIKKILMSLVLFLVKNVDGPVLYTYSKDPYDDTYEAGTPYGESVTVVWKGAMGSISLTLNCSSEEQDCLLTLSNSSKSPDPHPEASADHLLELIDRENYLLERILWDMSLL